MEVLLAVMMILGGAQGVSIEAVEHIAASRSMRGSMLLDGFEGREGCCLCKRRNSVAVAPQCHMGSGLCKHKGFGDCESCCAGLEVPLWGGCDSTGYNLGTLCTTLTTCATATPSEAPTQASQPTAGGCVATLVWKGQYPGRGDGWCPSIPSEHQCTENPFCMWQAQVPGQCEATLAFRAAHPAIGHGLCPLLNNDICNAHEHCCWAQMCPDGSQACVCTVENLAAEELATQSTEDPAAAQPQTPDPTLASVSAASDRDNAISACNGAMEIVRVNSGCADLPMYTHLGIVKINDEYFQCCMDCTNSTEGMKVFKTDVGRRRGNGCEQFGRSYHNMLYCI